MPVSLFRRQLLSSSEIKDEEGKTYYSLIKNKDDNIHNSEALKW